MSKERNKPRLGRGLSSLMALSDPAVHGNPEPVTPEVFQNHAGKHTEQVDPSLGAGAESSGPQGTLVLDVPLEKVRSNPYQPRRDFNEASIAELAASLKSTGLVQPIVVREVGGAYELIAGERRLRAARLAGFATLPAILKQVDAPTQAQMALVENIQREDLNPIDRAQAYRALLESLGLTQSELASRLGEDRSSIGHYLRLLELSSPVREMVRAGKLSQGHAKLLAGISEADKQEKLANRVLEESLSVRNLERVLSEEAQKSGGVAPYPQPTPPVASRAHLRDLEQTFTRHLGMKVQIKGSAVRGKGKLIIQYKTLDEFDTLKDRLGIQTE